MKYAQSVFQTLDLVINWKKKNKKQKKTSLYIAKIKPLMISFRIYFDNSKTNIMKF